MRIGIFGGSFNPVHIAHLIIAEHFVEAQGLERCYFVPAFLPPLKRAVEELAPAEHRLAMLERALAGNPRFCIEPCELQRGGISYTVETVHEFRQRFPDAQLLLLVGMDQLLEFRAWHRWEEIVQMAQLCVALRPIPVDQRTVEQELAQLRAHGASVELLQTPLLEVSSSEIRRRLRQGRSVRYLVPESVREYIVAHSLYAAPQHPAP
jgi:nicotinate-nucleotide adenylyltransferase